MALLADLFFLIYVVTLIFITGYSLVLGHLLIKYLKDNKKIIESRDEKPLLPKKDLPYVTIQLPIFNEMYVVERLIDCVMKQDYPQDRFEVQVLDDSTDETCVLASGKVQEYKDKGYHIQYIHRKDRKGFKAGALGNGLTKAKGEFFAIFDADFLPKPDFLKQTIHRFDNPAVGVVQTRWSHLNEEYSLLTRVQALQLNAHFRVEQKGRYNAGYFLQFNGTAGVWRRSAILDAGGWQADTLTEDLDLSIRTQLKGWKIVYLEEQDSPAELPSEISGLKSQQFRWMKGGAETARKMLGQIWKSGLHAAQKLHATQQLLAGSIFVLVFFLGLASVPTLYLQESTRFASIPLSWGSIGLITVFAVQFVSNANHTLKGKSNLSSLVKFVLLFPLFLALSMGLSLNNSIAVVEGWLGKKSRFIRTPKFNILSGSDKPSGDKYKNRKVPLSTWLEGLLTLYFFAAVILGFQKQSPGFLMLHLLFMLGYGTIFILSVKQLRLKSA